jgi:D-alanine-D-alanine ligase-like ATP-grasp enzyme
MLVADSPVRTVALIASDPYTDEANYDSTRWIAAALKQLGLCVEELDRSDPLPMLATWLRRHAVDWCFWNTSLNAYGEDGSVAGMLRALFPETPYVGSGPLGGAMSMDKEHCLDACRALGYPGPAGLCFHAIFAPKARGGEPEYTGGFTASTPEGDRYLAPMFRPWSHPERWLRAPAHVASHRPRLPRPDYEALAGRLGPRLVLKPLSSGASLGLRLVEDAATFQTALDEIAGRYGSVLIEECLEGSEYAVCILESHPQPLPICEIITERLHDTQDKLAPHYHIPAALPGTLASELHRVAGRLHTYIGCHGFSRIDLMVDQRGRIRPLEVNSNPGLIPGLSVFPAVCAAAGMDYAALIEKLLETAFLPRQREMARRTSTADVPPFPAALRALLPAQDAQRDRQSGALDRESPISIANYRC